MRAIGSNTGIQVMAKKRTVKPFYTKAMQRAEQMARVLMSRGHREAAAEIYAKVRWQLRLRSA